MAREAERTLTSLSRSYQEGIEDLTYEVLCVDNGSNPPLEAAWVEGFGPEFRLIRPEQPHPSPVGPMNAAALQAKGRYLAIMIDGAHVLTPGVVREAMAVLHDDPEAVVALRQWFIGGDQRWLALAGYTREMEDPMFRAIRWPEDGYGLFRIGAPMDESPQHWFRSLAESNCLFLPTAVYRKIGGYDEGFDEAGAGMANLDLFNRVTAATAPVVCLIGEATFHQFHGGTTTNVATAEKDRLVVGYMDKYQQIRGQPYSGFESSKLELRGQIGMAALKAQKRPLFPRTVLLTDELRPTVLEEQFDKGVQDYLISAYTEANADAATYWLGERVDLYPADLVAIQEAMTRSRPSRVVCVNTEPGLVRFVDSMLSLLRVDDPLIIWATEHGGQVKGAASRLKTINDNPSSKEAHALVLRNCAGAEGTMVLFGSRPQEPFPIEQLRAYAAFVSPRCYLVVLRTARGQPWIGYAKSRLRPAILELVRTEPGLVIDASWSRNVLTSCPSGFILRVGETNEAYDASLDDLTTI